MRGSPAVATQRTGAEREDRAATRQAEGGGRIRVLVVEDEPGLREVLERRLESWGYTCRAAAAVAEAESLLATFDPDLVLSDVRMPRLSGLDLIRRLRASGRRRLPVILITAHGTIDEAVRAMKEGARDFLTKPVDDGKLKALLESLTGEVRRERGLRALERALAEGGALGGLVGTSPAVAELRRLIATIGSADASALITGESGTGKEVVARAIHAVSGRSERAFVAVNTAAIPEHLVESEIMGHERGAFTGAVRSRPGCFELADGGTLFLDEVAEMPAPLQPKLLRVLEDGRVRRVGGTREVTFDVRVLAATNRSPEQAIEEGRLREDLFYRLNVLEVVIPTLRDRLEDLPLLCHHFIGEFNAKHGVEVEGISEAALDRLADHPWPGNVRELRNLMERGMILARRGWLEPAHFPALRPAAGDRPQPVLTLRVGITAAEAERQLIHRTLEYVDNNKAEAARRLGLDVKTVRKKLREGSD